jgi:hypothetical protein
MGRCIKSAREYAGYQSQKALVSALRNRGVRTSERSISDYESGKTIPALEVLEAIIGLCQPPRGWDFFFGDAAQRASERNTEYEPAAMMLSDRKTPATTAIIADDTVR